MRRLLRLGHGLAMLGAAVLLAVVAGAILARALFDVSGGAFDLMLPGAIEAARYSLLVMVLAALPRTLVAGLVRVDLLAARLPARLAGALDRLWSLAAAGIGGACAWLFAAETLAQAARGDMTQDLGLPLWPFTGFAALATALLCLAGLWLALLGRPDDMRADEPL